MLPLIVFTILLALAITRSPAASRERLVGFFEALCDAMLQLVRWVVALAPVGVFALILPLAARGAAGLAGGVGLYIAIYSIGCIVVVLLLYPAAAIVGGVPLRQFARAALPGQLIAFSTSSSIAAAPGTRRGRRPRSQDRQQCVRLRAARSPCRSSSPPHRSHGRSARSSSARFYGIPLHAPELAIIAFASVFLVFISPGIPRGGFLVLAPLFLAIGLPVEGIGILIAVDAIPDIFATLLNATGDLLATVLVARAMRTTPA